jgi:mono/diheme cytochrome c family protein
MVSKGGRRRVDAGRPVMQKHPFAIGFIIGIICTVLVGIAVWLTVVYTGAYNVAASDQHFDPVRWTFDTTMRRSVANRAGETELPENPQDLFAEGAGHYAESCVYCHGAPGQDLTEWSQGMRPEPPHLTAAARAWSPEEIHWIVSNGLKMTGMPAFGERHSSEEILALTAFVSALPGLSAHDYESLTGAARQPTEQTDSPAAGDASGEPQAETPAE